MTVVASNFERKHLDLYETEKWATEALLRHFPVQGRVVWEPAAGNHMIADVLRQHGAAAVITSDISTYDREHQFTYDFLSEEPLGPVASCLVTNPPYGKGNRDAVLFAVHALKQCAGWVALLLTAKFDFGKTRVHLFRDNPRYHAQLALLDRIQWFPGATTGTEDHCWFIWRPAEHPDTLAHKPAICLYEGKA